MDAVFRALADPTRRALLECIARAPVTVGKLALQFPISQPAVSQHLRILRDAKLVNVQKDKNQRLYSLRNEGLLAVRDYLDRYWTDVMDSFQSGVELE